MNNTKWLSESELAAWQCLAALIFRLPPVLDAQLQQDQDLNFADYMVMAVLSEEPKVGVRMSDLAQGLKLSQPRLTRIVTKLEKGGFVERENSVDDRRVVNAYLTDAGLEKITNAAPGHVMHVREAVIDRLTAQQIENLIDIGEALFSANPEGDETGLAFGKGCLAD